MIKRILLAAFVTLCTVGSYAQNMTLYQMHEIVQSNALNPAIPSKCKWMIGFPGLGNISVAAHTPFAYNDFNPGADVLSTSELVGKIKDRNMIAANANISWLTIGYRTDNNTYFQLSVNDRLSVGAGIPRELLEFVLQGNAHFVGQTEDFSVTGTAMHYREWALNVAHDFGSELWLGARARLLCGRLGFSSLNNDMQFTTAPGIFDLTMHSDITGYLSAPGTLNKNANGEITGFDLAADASHFIFNTSNVGGALDLGLTKTFDNGVKFSFSVADIAIISWTRDTKTIGRKSDITYSGYNPQVNSLGDLIDSVRAVAKVKEIGSEPFSQWLSPLFMTGVSTPLNDNLRLGGTAMYRYVKGGSPWALTASLFTENISWVTAGLSYTLTRNSFTNIGLGAGFHLGPVDITLLTDNIISVFSPQGQKYATLQLGINFNICSGNSGRRGSVPCAAYKGAVDPSGKPIRALPCPSGNSKKKRY